MNLMLLKTKLFIPQLKKGLVPRARLLTHLNEGLLTERGFARKLTLISAPAGYGKTTVARQWVEDFLSQVAWLTLDDDDNQPLFFLRYLIASIRTVEKDCCKKTWDFINNKSIFLAGLKELDNKDLVNFLNELIVIKKPLFIVLDDYHNINNREIQNLVIKIIENLPPFIHIVVTTRTDPPWPLHRWRVKRELAELRQKELAMITEEAQYYLNDLMECAINDQDIEILMKKTEGWPGSLQMAALSIKSSENITEFIKHFTGSSRYILDYFTDEVLRGQRAELKEFLLKTSLLSSLNPDLCNCIMGNDTSEELLAELEKANLFIIPTDNARKWYRYHPLFAQLLKVNLKKLYGESIEVIHQKAAYWYSKHKMPQRALEHAFALSDQEKTFSIFEENIEQLWLASGALQVSIWLDKLETKQLNQSLKLKLFKCILKMLNGEIAAAENDLNQIKNIIENEKRNEDKLSKSKIQDLMGLTAMVQAYIAKFKGDVQSVIEHSKIAMENLVKSKSLFRAGVAIVAGDASLLTGDFKKATAAYNDAILEGKKTDNYFFVQLAYASEIFTNWFIGNLNNTEAICKAHLQFAQRTDMAETARAGLIWALWGDVLRERNQLDLAYTYIQKGCKLSSGETLVLIWPTLILSKIYLSQNKIDDAQQAISKFERMLEGTSRVVGFEQAFRSLRLKLFLKQDPALAEKYLRKYQIFSCQEINPFNIGIYIVMARVLFVLGEVKKANELLNRIYPVAHNKQMTLWTIEIQLLKAIVLYDLGNVDGSVAAIASSLSFAHPEGYLRIFLDEGPKLINILKLAQNKGLYQESIQTLLRNLTVKQQEQTNNHLLQLQTALSEREIEIITLISQGKSNQEIAAMLFLSLNTVKWHASNIYSKLLVQNRTEAVAKAKKLKIIN